MAKILNIDRQNGPLPVLRGSYVADITSTNLQSQTGFIAQVNSAGDSQTVVFETFAYPGRQTRTIAAGEFIGNCGGIPTELRYVESANDGAGTVTSVIVGLL